MQAMRKTLKLCFAAAMPTLAIGLCSLLAAMFAPAPLLGQGTAQLPEYYGFYALDAGKLIAIGGGSSSTAPTIHQVSVLNLGSQQQQRPAVVLTSSTHFLLYDISPAGAARAVSIFRLPFVRNFIMVSDVPVNGYFNTATNSPRNSMAMLRMQSNQLHLLQKPVPSQPQMIELVPNPALGPGLYGVLFAPAAGGVGAGQAPGWTALLLVGDEPAQDAPCIDISMTGGMGGILGMDSPDAGSIASFPLLDPHRTSECGPNQVAPGAEPAPQAPAATPPADTATATDESEPALLAKIDRGENVAFKVRYTQSSFSTGLAQRDGVVRVSKTAVVFEPTIGGTAFSVTPGKIVELINQPQEARRVHLKVMITNAKNGKEEKKTVEFYHPATFINGYGISCQECDDSMSVLYDALQKVTHLP